MVAMELPWRHSYSDQHTIPLFQTSIENCTFEDNFLPSKVDGPIVDLISVDVSLTNCTFVRSTTIVYIFKEHILESLSILLKLVVQSILLKSILLKFC